MTASLELSVPVQAPADEVWAAAVDWEAQGSWMLATRVRTTTPQAHGVGAGAEAFTGLGPFGILDTMVVTAWDPPRRCAVLHTGRVVRGPGAFEVRETGPRSSLFVWSEDLELPFGVLGRLGWPLVRPVFVLGLRYSLRRFARWVERGRPSARAA